MEVPPKKRSRVESVPHPETIHFPESLKAKMNTTGLQVIRQIETLQQISKEQFADVLLVAIDQNNLDLVTRLLNSIAFRFDCNTAPAALPHAAYVGNLHMVKLLLKRCGITWENSAKRITDAFLLSLGCPNPYLCQWFRERFNIQSPLVHFSCSYKCVDMDERDTGMAIAAYRGSEYTMSWLLRTYLVSQSVAETAFIDAMYYDNLAVAKVLASQYRFSENAVLSAALCATEADHLDTCKWLMKKVPLGEKSLISLFHHSIAFRSLAVFKLLTHFAIAKQTQLHASLLMPATEQSTDDDMDFWQFFFTVVRFESKLSLFLDVIAKFRSNPRCPKITKWLVRKFDVPDRVQSACLPLPQPAAQAEQHVEDEKELVDDDKDIEEDPKTPDDDAVNQYFKQFCDECVTLGPGARCSFSLLYWTFGDWCKRNGFLTICRFPTRSQMKAMMVKCPGVFISKTLNGYWFFGNMCVKPEMHTRFLHLNPRQYKLQYNDQPTGTPWVVTVEESSSTEEPQPTNSVSDALNLLSTVC